MAAPALTPAPSLTFPGLLWRGLVAGAGAGLAAALVSLLVVEPPLQAALAVEESAGGHHHAEELFSRPTQVVGGMVAALVVATAFGLIFAVVFARTRHRLPARTDLGRAALLAALGFAGIALLPGLKYPASPPGVGESETVTSRTLLWLSFVGAMLVIAYLTFVAREKLAVKGWAPERRELSVVAGAALAVIGCALLWPDRSDPIPAALPAAVLWEFRLASLLELAALWAVLGLGFGALLGIGRPASR